MDSKFRFVALQLCTVLGLVYFLQASTGFNPGFNASASPFYKFFTSVLGHSGLEHLLNNLFFLGLFGSIYERYTSGKLFLFTFLVSALLANISAFVFFPSSYIIGASGGAMGVLAALAVYRPKQIGLALGVPLPMWAVFIIYTLIQFAGLTGSTNTAYEAHLLGMVSGGLIGYRLREEDLLSSDGGQDEQDEWRERIREWEDRWMM
ncbi:MAG: rhomboid family intramembrane serine protease [Nanohaloarchaea archaeon]|nr:rhomboid family intramembrane serine protease [Candidatus Nanohaloarchaea archaeon]